MQEETKVKTYFKNRGVNSDTFNNFVLPAYLKQILPENKNAKIIDIGCGFGQILQAIKELGYNNVQGIDISDESISHCSSIGLNVKKITDLNEFLESSEGNLDFALMTHVIEHIEKPEIIKTLKNIKKILSPSGYLYLATPNAQANTGSYWMYEDFTHTTIFTSGSLIYVLKSAGFQDITFVDPEDVERHSPIGKILKKSLLSIYKLNKKFWNKVTASAYHAPSPVIYAFELKVKAK